MQLSRVIRYTDKFDFEKIRFSRNKHLSVCVPFDEDDAHIRVTEFEIFLICSYIALINILRHWYGLKYMWANFLIYSCSIVFGISTS